MSGGRACNQAATYASQVAFAKSLKDRNGLQQEVYADLKAAFELSAQPVVRAVKKVVDAYAALKAGLQKSGNLGPPASKRYRKAGRYADRLPAGVGAALR